MAENIHLTLEAQYTARSGFFWRKVANSSFKRWQRKARSATWRNLAWDWELLGITSAARAAADRLGFVPSEVFAHPDVIVASPELEDTIGFLPACRKQGIGADQFKWRKGQPDRLCKLLNRILSYWLPPARASQRVLLNTMFAEAGTEWQGTWVNSIGLQAAQAVELDACRFAGQRRIAGPGRHRKID